MIYQKANAVHIGEAHQEEFQFYKHLLVLGFRDRHDMKIVVC
jgi:hypothetical protein